MMGLPIEEESTVQDNNNIYEDEYDNLIEDDLEDNNYIRYTELDEMEFIRCFLQL